MLEEKEGAENNTKVKALLDELFDLFLEDLPKYLPHEMAVDHCIDVEPEKTQPHKTPYRLSNSELEELQKQG